MTYMDSTQAQNKYDWNIYRDIVNRSDHINIHVQFSIEPDSWRFICHKEENPSHNTVLKIQNVHYFDPKHSDGKGKNYVYMTLGSLNISISERLCGL